jgi:hypothetical protein
MTDCFHKTFEKDIIYNNVLMMMLVLNVYMIYQEIIVTFRRIKLGMMKEQRWAYNI